MGLTQKELADSLLLDVRTIKKYEAREINLSLNRINDFSFFFDVDPSLFIYDHDNTEPFTSNSLSYLGAQFEIYTYKLYEVMNSMSYILDKETSEYENAIREFKELYKVLRRIRRKIDKVRNELFQDFRNFDDKISSN